MNDLPTHMRAVLLTGHGGPEALEFRDDLPLPVPAYGEVLIAVGACGMNNTDINTRVGWYSKSVSGATPRDDHAGGVSDGTDGGWGAELHFPRIQGADVAGRIVAVGEGVAASRIGERVLVDPWLRDPVDPADRSKSGYLGSERNGGFAEYTTVPSVNAFAIHSDCTDAEIATFPCSSSTAEHMLSRATLEEGETVVVTGASGGVGSALVQLAKRRGAFVIALAGRSKLEAVRALGVDFSVARDAPDLAAVVRAHAPGGEIDVAADVVGGAGFTMLIDLLRRGGRYVTSGAIAGPIVELDLRTLYLRDLTLIGATVMPRDIFARLVGYIEKGEIKPLLAKTFDLADLAAAQSEFLAKSHVGNFVVIPDPARRW